MKASAIMFLALAITISGCTITTNDQVDNVPNKARNDLMQAKDAYTKCLQENNAEPQKCAGFKEAYEVDLQAYRAISTSGSGAVYGNYYAPSNK
jgi:hypothetical protein